MSTIVVSSHIGRDLLQAASVFKTADIAVWEYIVNSLQYVGKDTKPTITVDINHKLKSITISDNGRGMDLEGLNNFFRMHGENIDRKSGKGGRGKFGTGKSAAFGIGKKLTVTTVYDNKLNTITLHKDDIQKSSGGEIPVNIVVQNENSDDMPTGTSIVISEIFIPKIDSQKIIKKIEKHLQSFRHSSPSVLVGDHVCEYREPTFSETIKFSPDELTKKYLGTSELTVKVSNSPLTVDERGVLVSCGIGNLVALEDAGVCSKEMGEYLFGEIDVPDLDSSKYDADAFDASRDMKLRPEHPVVIALNMFLGTSLEKVRKQLVQKKKEASKSAECKKLKEHANKIADLLNNDYKELNDKILEIRSSTSTKGQFSSRFGSENTVSDGEDGWVSGESERGTLETSDNENDNSTNEAQHRQAPEIPDAGKADDQGDSSVDPISENKSSRKKRSPRGGFTVEYEEMGANQDRAIYTADKGVFTINLDHPLVKSAVNHLGIEDIGFQRLSHEIIFSEYALALANMAAVDDPDIPADDVIYDARETLNRISAKSAILYSI